MKIKDYEVPQNVIDACEARMRLGVFKAADITATAEKAGAPQMVNREWVSPRIADRLIQKNRKSGNIRMIDRRPTWEFQANDKGD